MQHRFCVTSRRQNKDSAFPGKRHLCLLHHEPYCPWRLRRCRTVKSCRRDYCLVGRTPAGPKLLSEGRSSRAEICGICSQVGSPVVSPHRCSRLRFSRRRLFFLHADLRVSLPEVRTRQRNPRPLQRLEGNRLSALRFKEIVQEIFRLRLRRRRRRAVMRKRRGRLLRGTLRRAAPALKVEPMAGIEPATDGLRNRCSTAELHWLPSVHQLVHSDATHFGRVQVNGKSIRVRGCGGE